MKIEAKLCTCGIALNRSVLRLHHKSCTSCSLKAGQHVFHPLECFVTYIHKNNVNEAIASQCDECKNLFKFEGHYNRPCTQTDGGLEAIDKVTYPGTLYCNDVEASEV